ncbi:MAG: plastocyanin/azurin family copper-binding protein [Alphaproteobacteria bacterium]|nr:plastocyanin/azurin family copper-binding protein [Alphaproteobacteria bacterium]
MAIRFEKHHAAMLLKYSGISFISGAVNHGFFSGERSLWTAAIGILLFVAGAVMAHRLEDEAQETQSSLTRTLLLGALLSIGLGFFTGGLQHFPDSPARSAWVVPLGFFLSIPALALSSSYEWRTPSTVYAVSVGVLVALGSHGAWQWLERNPQYLGTHAHAPAGHDASEPDITALKVDRTVQIRMNDEMRFVPDVIQVRAGETLRLQVFNDGKVPHELVLGSDSDIAQHALDMQKGGGHDAHAHGPGAAIELEPGAQGDLVVRFNRTTTLQMACLIPGHYQAGMKGRVQFIEGGPSGADTVKRPAQAHDHSTHKH